MFNEKQISLWISHWPTMPKKLMIFKNIIIDRKSKYTVVAINVKEKDEVKNMYDFVKKDSYFKKATHNSYAFRISLENGSILEGKNDDGEIWAGMCILRELQRENAQNMMIIVTRYFWGIKLENDRFKNIIHACKIFFQKITKNEPF